MKRPHTTFRRVVLAAMLSASGMAFTALGVLVLQMPGRYQGLTPGDRLPHVHLVAPDGEPVDTSLWGGRPTLLMLLDPECPGCLMELDNINTLAPTMPGLRVVLLSTLTRDKTDGGSFAYADPTGVLTRRMRRFAVPAVYWIGSDGRVLYARSGARSLADDASTFYALLSREDARGTPSHADGSGASLR